MTQSIKQRMIGAVIIAALAVIFIPMLLDGPVDQGPTDLPIEIPPRPVVAVEEELGALPETPPAPDEAFTASVPLDVERPASEALAGAATEPAPAAPRQPQAAPAPELAAWAVQVGSFGHEANAVALRDKLRGAGYKAYVDSIDAEGQRFYRVRVGPFVTREEADRLKTDLAGKVQLKGLVVSHP